MRFKHDQNGNLLVDHGLGWAPAPNQAPLPVAPQYGVGAMGQAQTGGYIAPVVGALLLFYAISFLGK